VIWKEVEMPDCVFFVLPGFDDIPFPHYAVYDICTPPLGGEWRRDVKGAARDRRKMKISWGRLSFFM
jgi:hypothetical protein